MTSSVTAEPQGVPITDKKNMYLDSVNKILKVNSGLNNVC